MTPKRIQLRRTKGWRKPEGAVVVSRPSKWGNPFSQRTAEANVQLYRVWLEGGSLSAVNLRAQLHELTGRDLCCWCPLDKPCHADVLIELANKSQINGGE